MTRNTYYSKLKAITGARDTEISHVIGVTSNSVSRKMRGESGISDKEVVKLNHYFQNRMDALNTAYAGIMVQGVE